MAFKKLPFGSARAAFARRRLAPALGRTQLAVSAPYEASSNLSLAT